jgi:hypothetical protein
MFREDQPDRGQTFGGSTGRGVQSWGQAQDEPGRGHYGAEDSGRYTGQSQGYGREHGSGGFQGDYRGGSGQGGFGGRGDWDGGRQSFSSGGGRHHDPHYLDWRNRQIEELDRDYEDYHRERQHRFHDDFSTWRQNRQGQRTTANRPEEAGRPSDLAGGGGAPSSPAQAGTDYAGEPGPAGMRGENHMDPVKIDESADPRRS